MESEGRLVRCANDNESTKRMDKSLNLGCQVMDDAHAFVQDGVFANAVTRRPSEQRPWHNLQILVIGTARKDDHVRIEISMVFW